MKMNMRRGYRKSKKRGPVRAKKVTFDGIQFASGLEKYMYKALKLVEEVGETCKAILNDDDAEIIDGIGDCVVVLTNLAELIGTPIEECIDKAYNEIKNRKGKMANGTYVKDEK